MGSDCLEMNVEVTVISESSESLTANNNLALSLAAKQYRSSADQLAKKRVKLSSLRLLA
jgi:hypothetical protein